MKTSLTPMRLAILAALLLTAAPLAAQDIYKCSKDGQPVYTDHPCPDGHGQLLHKADDAEVIDQYLRLGQDKLAKQYADSRHLDALYQDRLDAYQQTLQENADRQADEELAAQQRQEEAQQQALAADAAANRERLRDENDALRQENDDYRNQLSEPVYNTPSAYWGNAPSYGYGGNGGHRDRDRDRDHNHYDPHQPHPQPQKPVFHPCTQLAGGRVNC